MKHICILLSIVLLGYCSLITADLINPNAASISYRGRFDLSNINKAAWFEWSGVSIDLHLTTSDVSTIGIYLTEKGNQGNRYNIWDLNRNAVVMVLNTSTGSQLYSLGGSAQSAFTYPIAIRVEKRTEAFWGAAAFLGFDVATNNNQPLNPQDIAPRSAQKIRGAPRPNRIEFIGDSLTCAYGNEGQAPCSFSQATQNAHLSFATVTAMALNADYHIQCWSGKGIVRNAGSKNSTSPDPIGYYYPRTLPTETDSVWNPSDWELIDSDAIVITLGGNDFSAPQSAWPTYEQIFDGYQTLVDYVQSTYNSTGVPPIVFLAVGPLPNDPDVYVGRVVEDLNALGNDRVYFINMKGTLTDPSHDVGCDGHPSVSGDAKMAAKMTKIMQSVLNWQ